MVAIFTTAPFVVSIWRNLNKAQSAKRLISVYFSCCLHSLCRLLLRREHLERNHLPIQKMHLNYSTLLKVNHYPMRCSRSLAVILFLKVVLACSSCRCLLGQIYAIKYYPDISMKINFRGSLLLCPPMCGRSWCACNLQGRKPCDHPTYRLWGRTH